MLGREYGQNCSAARTLELIGERWTMLVIRDVFSGRRRFDQIQQSLGVARNVLSSRLQLLIDEGILEKRVYQERPERHEYFLTEKGLDLWPILIALIGFGDKHLTAEGAEPVLILHKGCDGRINDRRICERCGAHVEVREAYGAPGPGAVAQAA